MLNIASCNLSTGSPLFTFKYTGVVFHVPNVPPNRYLNILSRVWILSPSFKDKRWNFLVMTLFRSKFSYLAYNIIHICRVELIVVSDSKHSLTYELVKYYSIIKNLYVKYVKSFIILTIGDDYLLNGPLTPIIMLHPG